MLLKSLTSLILRFLGTNLINSFLASIAMVSTRRTKRVSNPIVPVANVEEKMDTSEAPKLQKNKSNRWWKKTQTAP